MITLRRYSELGGNDAAWLKARLHFAVGNLGNPVHTPLGALRVWNDDEIQPRSGFPLHRHENVEIITFVRDGAVTHKDSLGNVGRTPAGSVQVMSAASGIHHSEANEESVVTRLFQIWLTPRTSGGSPHWENRPFPPDSEHGELVVLASGVDEDLLAGALPFNADARVLGVTLRKGEMVTYHVGKLTKAYLVATRGTVVINDVDAAARDGVAIEDEEDIAIVALEDTEVLLVHALPPGSV
jgi:redox-sensitive bicupin YhaK (pirin superfamily)